MLDTVVDELLEAEELLEVVDDVELEEEDSPWESVFSLGNDMILIRDLLKVV